MKKLKEIFSKKVKPCQIMSGLTFKSIPVHYSASIIQGIDRPEKFTFHTVAVKTTQTDAHFNSYNDWMLAIQMEKRITKAEIAFHEDAEGLISELRYSKSIKAITY